MTRTRSGTHASLETVSGELAGLGRDVARLSAFLDRHAVLQEATRILTAEYRFDCAWFAEQSDPEAVVIRHTSGMTTDAAPNLRLRRGCGLGGKVFALNKIQWVDDYFSSRQITHHYDGTVRAENIHRIIGAPICFDGQIVGVVMGGTRDGETFGSQAATVMEMLSNRIEEALRVEAAARAKVAAAVLEERTRTALELQDTVVAMLLAIATGVRSASESAADPLVRERLVGLEHRTKEAAATLRESLRTLQASNEKPEWCAAMRRMLHGLESRELADTLHGAGTKRRPHSLIRQREYDVLCRVAMGDTNQEIAEATNLSQNTVKSYLRNLMQRLGARNRVEAISRAREAGLL